MTVVSCLYFTAALVLAVAMMVAGPFWIGLVYLSLSLFGLWATLFA